MGLIRHYYLYIYFWISEKNRNKKGQPDKFIGFIFLSLLLIPMKLIVLVALFWGVSDSFDGFVKFLNENVFYTSSKGPITGLVAITWGLSGVITYYLCCFKVKYDDIESILSEKPLFSSYSGLTLFLFTFVPLALFMVVLLVKAASINA